MVGRPHRNEAIEQTAYRFQYIAYIKTDLGLKSKIEDLKLDIFELHSDLNNQ